MNTSEYGIEPPPDENDFKIQEEEERNRAMMEILKEKEKQHRKFVRELELQKLREEQEEELRKAREAYSNKMYLDRRNASAKLRAKVQNERLKNLLHKVESYMKRIENVDSIEDIKLQADSEYKQELEASKKKKLNKEQAMQIVGRLTKLNKKNEELRKENLDKIQKEKEKNEKEKKRRMNVGKQSTMSDKQFLQNNNNTMSKPSQIVSMFQEENIVGTNLSPNEEMQAAVTYKRINSAKMLTQKSSMPFPAINSTASAEKELRQIIKNGNNLQALQSFKSKYKWFDITPYLHRAKMTQIKTKGTLQPKRPYTSSIVRESEAMLEKTEGNNHSAKYSTYLSSCKLNNSEYIQAHLLASKDDNEVYNKVNEFDEFNRKGICYLILHGNYSMIRLSLLSGVILSNCVDIYGRNIIHYSIMSEYGGILEVICRCMIFEYKEDYKGMESFVENIFIGMRATEDANEELINQRLESVDKMVINRDKVGNTTTTTTNNNPEALLPKNSSTPTETNLFSLISKGANYITNKVNFFQEIKKMKTSLTSLINSHDIDNKIPLHYACLSKNFDAIKTLLYYNSKTDVYDCNKKRPIDLCQSDNVIQYILAYERNAKSKGNLYNNKINANASGDTLPGNRIDYDSLKYMKPEQVNKFTTGYENNNYLIMSVIENKFDIFCFLVSEKEANVIFVNSNGWTVLHFIFYHRRLQFFCFLFNIIPSTEDVTEENIFKQLNTRFYSNQDIYNPKGKLNYTGECFSILDNVTNNNVNCVYMAIDIFNSLYLVKSLIILYQNKERLFASCSPIDVVVNRKYGKHTQSLLLKSVEKNNMDIIRYIVEESCTIETETKVNVDIYLTDKKLQNPLHYAVKNKGCLLIHYFIKLDAEKNLLRTMKDANGKLPKDYDTANIYTLEFSHIWDAAAANDHILLEKIINEKNYYTVNDQLSNSLNTPLHVAALNQADRAVLFLIKNSCNLRLKNAKKMTALEVITNNISIPKSFIKKFISICEKEITEYSDLDKLNKAKMDNTNSSMIINTSALTVMTGISRNINFMKKINEIKSKIKNEIEKRKLNMKKIFQKLDKNKNGKLEGHEFESLFTILDINGLSRDDVLLLSSELDANKNGLIEYEEFLKIFEDS